MLHLYSTYVGGKKCFPGCFPGISITGRAIIFNEPFVAKLNGFYQSQKVELLYRPFKCTPTNLEFSLCSDRLHFKEHNFVHIS